MLLARLLSVADFGLWAFFLSVFTMFDMLRSGLLSSATIKYYTEGQEAHELVQIEKSVLQLSTAVTFLSFLFPLVYFVFGFQNAKPELYTLAVGVVPLSFVSILPTLATWIAQAKQNFRVILRIRMIIQLTFFLVIASGYIWPIDLELVFYGYCLSYALAALWVLFTGRVKLMLLFGPLGTWCKRIVKFGGYSMGTLLGSNLLRNSDTYIIMAFLNEASVAIYNVPNRIMGLLDIPIQAFSSADYPRLVSLIEKKQFSELQTSFNKGLGISLLVVWPAAILVFFAAKWIVVLIAGIQYENSYLIMRIFAIYAMLLPLDRYTGLMLDALGIPKRNMAKVVLMLVANVVLDIVVLTAGYGLEAVAAVSLITYSTGIVFGFSSIKHVVRIQLLQSLSLAIRLVLSKMKR